MARNGDRRARLRAMLGGGEHTIENLTTALGCSDRQLRRLIGELRAEGLRVEEDREGPYKRFVLAPEHRPAGLELADLTVEEGLALAVAAEASRAALRGTPMGQALETAFAKLLERFGPELFAVDAEEEVDYWHFGGSAASAFDPAIFRTLETAVRERRRVLIDYTTASTGKRSADRLIEPYALAVRNGSWLAVAYCCRVRRKVLDFSVAGITRAAMLDPAEDRMAIFERPEDFDLDAYFAERFNALAGEPRTVRLLVNADRAEYFRRKRYHPSQLLEEGRADGSLVVSFTVAGLEEMRSFAMSWGGGLRVLEPAELAAMIREEAGKMVEG